MWFLLMIIITNFIEILGYTSCRKKLFLIQEKPSLEKIYKGQNTLEGQMFCNVLVCASLWCIYHMTKAVQAMESTHCDWLYHGIAITLCIALFCVWFESHTRECAL